MRFTKILRPAKIDIVRGPITINDPTGAREDGPRQFKTNESSSYSVRLHREGDELSRNQPSLNLDFETSIDVPGKHQMFLSPSTGGYMPQSLSLPYSIRVALSETPTLDQYYGKTALNVRKFNRMSFQTPVGGDQGQFLGIESRLFEFNGGLFFLAESAMWINGKINNIVKLYKYSEQSDSFSESYLFTSQPIDSDIDSNQIGSADHFVWEDRLHVVYRIINRDENKSYIVVFRGNEDLTDWDQISSTLIKDTATHEFTIRLRAAYSEHSVMVVVYMICKAERGLEVIHKPDMRSFVSYDGGFTLVSKNTSYRNVKYNDGRGIDKIVGTSTMAQMFIPGSLHISTTDIKPFNRNFSLYYDKNMGEYVILKSGDPVGTSDNYLIGIKTVENDIHSWETCVSLKLDDTISAIPPEPTSPWNPYEESGAYVNGLTLLDLDVSQGPLINTAIIHARVEDGYSSISTPEFVFLVQFTFAPSHSIKDPIIPNTESMFAYGGKFHKDYAFISSPWNPLVTGVSTTGVMCDGRKYLNPMICTYRGQIMTLCRNLLGVDNQGVDQRPFSCLTMFNLWQNFQDKYGYQFALSAQRSNPVGDNYVSQDMNIGVITYTPYERINAVILGSGGHAFLKLDSPPYEPNIMEKASINHPMYFKTRFTLKINGIDGAKTLTFLKAGTSDGVNGYSIVLTAKVGALDVHLIDGTLLLTIPDFDWSKTYEFITGVSSSITGNSAAWLLHKEKTNIHDNHFKFGFRLPVVPAPVAAPIYNIGAVVTTGMTSGHVRLYDFQISSFVNGYRPITQRKKWAHHRPIDGLGFYSSTPADFDDYHLAGTADLYDHIVDLWDGSQIELLGNSDNAVTLWNYGNTSSGNSIGNVTNEVSNSVWDFQNSYNNSISPAPSHCHCYETTYNLAEPLSSEGAQVVFKNHGNTLIDGIGILNIHGVHCFDVITGTYDDVTDTWSSTVVNNLRVPRIKLDYDPILTGSHSKTIFMSSILKDIEDGQLENYSILIYNTASKNYTGQMIVKTNSRVTISVEQDIPSLVDSEIHLMVPYLYETLKEVVPASHIGFRFYASETARYKNIGEIIAGRSSDISHLVTDVEVKSKGAMDTNTSSFDFTYSPRYAAQPLASVASISYHQSREINNSMRDLIFNSIRVPNVLLVHHQHDGVPILGYGNFSSISESQNFSKSGSTDFTFQDFLGVLRSAKNPAAPQLTVSMPQGSTADTGVNLEFLGEVVSEGDPLKQTVTWDFGDGTTVVGNLNPSHSYSNYGEFNAKLIVTDEWNQTSTAKIKAFVVKPVLTKLSMTTTALPLAVGVNHLVTVNTIDVSGSVATWNNSSKITVRDMSGGLLVDLNNNVVFNEDPQDTSAVSYQVENGEWKFRIKSMSVGSYIVEVEDQFGSKTRKTITFA